MKSKLPITSSIGICDGFNLLIPSNLIVEVVSAAAINASETSEDWSTGRLNWRGLDIPVLGIEQVIINRPPRLRGSHVAIFHGTLQAQNAELETTEQESTDAQSMGKLPFYGVPLQAVPHSFSINQSREVTQRSDHLNLNFCQMKVTVKGVAAIIPDLQRLEQFILDNL